MKDHKTTFDQKRETMIVPVVTMEEVSILSEKERADLIVSLKHAEAEAAAGKSKLFNRKEFKKRFLAICRSKIA